MIWKRKAKREMVHIYDVETGAISTNPAVELASGMVRIAIRVYDNLG
jgi:hypothetical protein